MEKLVTVFLVSVGFTVMSVAIGAIAALPVMWLWNGILPGLFGFPTIGYLKSWGLLILCGLLFKTSCPSSSH